jgi:chemotaxis protein MotB
MSDRANAPIIVKKIKKVAAGHHGGSWKVAYADFVTAMMAFFLLLWLLNVTTDEQKSGIADYFAPTTATFSRSGSGDVFAGLTVSIDGAKTSDATAAVVIEVENEAPPEDVSEQALREELARREEEAFADTKLALEEAIQSNPELEEFSEHLKVDVTEEGLRIQIVDQEGGSMFPSGSASMPSRTKKLVAVIAKIITPLPNNISVSGHTDATPFRSASGNTNWELSTDRANSSRRALIETGIDPDRFVQITGKADTEPLTLEDPFQPQNRRIAIVLKREVPVLPPELRKDPKKKDPKKR